jgi:hypothetical protein
MIKNSQLEASAEVRGGEEVEVYSLNERKI